MIRKKATTIYPTILVNDPSLTAWGWALVTTDGRVIDAGAIKTKPSDKKLRIRKGDDNVRRVAEISRPLNRLIDDNNVGLILGELPHGSQTARAAMMIGMCAGILQTISEIKGVPIEWYSEGDAKKCVLNKRSASKQEMIDKINSLYEVPWKSTKWENEGIADAMAIYHTGREQSQLMKIL